MSSFADLARVKSSKKGFRSGGFSIDIAPGPVVGAISLPRREKRHTLQSFKDFHLTGPDSGPDCLICSRFAQHNSPQLTPTHPNSPQFTPTRLNLSQHREAYLISTVAFADLVASEIQGLHDQICMTLKPQVYCVMQIDFQKVVLHRVG